jgi:Fe-S cluster assembly protein SufD
LEQDRVESHLNPPASYDLADHPVPTGREEIWRFTPLKRLRGILDGEASDTGLTWDTTLPAGVTLTEIGDACSTSIPTPRWTSRSCCGCTASRSTTWSGVGC